MYELPPATRFSSNRICQWGLQSAARLKWEAPLPGPPQGLPAGRKGDAGGTHEAVARAWRHLEENAGRS